jgi:hypothetical protein
MLLETVINIVKDYEKQNPGSGDRGSMADALDIAEITANNIKGIIQSGELDPDMVDLVPFDEVKENLLANTEETDPDDEEDE